MQLENGIKTFRSDKGGEFVYKPFNQILKDHGIEKQTSTPFRVVYCVVMEANPGIMLCRHDTYPSQHYVGCCLYPDGLEFYWIFKHHIKEYGTFGSPKIAKHVHFGPKGTWERVCERSQDTVSVCGNVHGILSGNMGACMWTRLGTSYQTLELHWERGNMGTCMGNIFGNMFKCLGQTTVYCTPLTYKTNNIHY